MKTKYLLPLAALSAVAAVVSPVRADQSYVVYLYVNGVPTDVTPNAYVSGGHVFLNGSWIGSLNVYGHIIDANNQLIGYVVEDGGEIGLKYSHWWKAK